MIAFGKPWPEGINFADIHLYCYRHWDPFDPHLLPKHEHFITAIKLLWPEEFPGGKKGFIWSEWSYRRAKAWCDYDYQTWWGPSSSGKSTDAAIFALAHWLSMPQGTTITVCSTGLEYLRKRIWREILRFHSMRRGLPGEPKKQPPAILYVDPSKESAENTIDGIHGAAVPRGQSATEAGGMIGVHNDYNVLIVDEMQATDESVISAFDNLSTGKEAKFLGLGNPSTRTDPLGRASEPAKGWDSINPTMEEWRTKNGMCLFFDGLKSPAIKNPEKYFFFLKQKDIDRMMKDPGPDSKRFWSQRRGFLPPEGLTDTIMTETFIDQFNMRDSITWADKWKLYAAFDPSFSSGGDKAVYVPFKVGTMTDMNVGIEFQSPSNVQHAMSGDKALTYMILEEVMALLLRDNIPLERFGMDTTGSQRTLADVLEKEWNEKMKKQNPNHKYQSLLRVDFAGGASDRMLSPSDPRLAKEKYSNRVTELWFQFRTYAQNGHIRGLWEDAIEQLTAREILPTVMKRGRETIETKDLYKQRTGGKSPDDADAAVIATEVVREIAGIEPEQRIGFDHGENAMEATAREDDLYFLDGAYSEEYCPLDIEAIM